MQYRKPKLPGLLLSRQLIQSLVLLSLLSVGWFQEAVAQTIECSTSLAPHSIFPHSHPELWLLAGMVILIAFGTVLWRQQVAKQFHRLHNIQATLEALNAELSQEIYDRQQVEQKLRQSEAKLAEAQKVVHIGSWEFDLQTEQITWSTEMFLLFGFDPVQPEPSYEELVQRIHPNDKTQWQQQVYNAMATGASYLVDHRVILPDGTIRYIEGRGEAEIDRHGQVIRLFGTGMDITDRKQAEIALRESEERFRAIFEQAAVGICVDTLEGKALQMNQRFCDITGYSPDEICSAHWSERTYPDDREADWAKMQQLLAGEIENFSLEKRYFRKNQAVVWVNLTVSLIYDAVGEPQNLLIIIQDISEAKHLEAQRQQTEAALRKSEATLQRLNQELLSRTRQLEATNRELESFSYSVSHDLRAPSRHIHGFVSVLRQHLEQQPLQGEISASSESASSESASAKIDSKVSHYLDVIETSSRKMGLLIDGLLSLSRVGRRRMECRPVPLQMLVNEAIEIAKLDSDGRAIEFRIGDLPTVNGDAVLLQQVLLNVINNAIKFSRHADTPCVEIGSLPDHTVFVRDNGIGFAMEDADHIFDAFQRLHGREFEGTGIGLAIVQRIVHRHNGDVWVKSQPNQGATFYFKL